MIPVVGDLPECVELSSLRVSDGDVVPSVLKEEIGREMPCSMRETGTSSE